MSADLSTVPPPLLALALATAPDEETAERVRAELERRRVTHATSQAEGVATPR